MAAMRSWNCSPLRSTVRTLSMMRTTVPHAAPHSAQTAGCHCSSPGTISRSGTSRGISLSAFLPHPPSAPAEVAERILKKSRRSMVSVPLVVACGTVLGGFVLPVAGQARAHVVLDQEFRGGGLRHVAVAGGARDPGADVRGMPGISQMIPPESRRRAVRGLHAGSRQRQPVS